MQNSLPFAFKKSALSTVFLVLMVTFVFTGCSATGPFQSHSAFRQSLPSGYQTDGYQSAYQNQTGYAAQGTFAPQWQSANYPPAYAPQAAYGYGVTPQLNYGFGGQAAYPQSNPGLGRGLMSPFVGGTYTSGSC